MKEDTHLNIVEQRWNDIAHTSHLSKPIIHLNVDVRVYDAIGESTACITTAHRIRTII